MAVRQGLPDRKGVLPLSSGLSIASHWWPCPVLPGLIQFQLFSFGFDTRILWNEGVLLVKALVGSCCGSNLGLAFLSLSVCISPSLTLVTFLCSRGRRNSHARHQVDTFICPNLHGVFVYTMLIN